MSNEKRISKKNKTASLRDPNDPEGSPAMPRKSFDSRNANFYEAVRYSG
jgi:hypothetical protein